MRLSYLVTRLVDYGVDPTTISIVRKSPSIDSLFQPGSYIRSVDRTNFVVVSDGWPRGLAVYESSYDGGSPVLSIRVASRLVRSTLIVTVGPPDYS